MGFKEFPKGFNNAKIAVLEHPQSKILFAGRHLNKQSLILKNMQIYIILLFRPLYHDPLTTTNLVKEQ